ncbi:glycosyltransferase [Aurantibacter crassamenti]|uniref:glycosyltransferase n=1 Tax=Aurantibacter crassamenti TaxID=1837375 RepID=UPI001939E6E1|nr:glycosyltransferase [Aurantibacter crassamenti]MBM1105811.1 glycosyltransferase [Aurantibacter crassamenti]
MKSKILFILHLPPPIHGASMVSKRIKDSSIINTTFSADYLNLATSFSLDDIGKRGQGKISALFNILKNTTKALIKTKYDLCYMTLTAKGPGFYKDVFVVLLLKLFRKKIVYHFHNKGVKANSYSWLKRLCYRIVFRKTKSILLSPLLYDDISMYVKSKDVFFCPNGIPEVETSIKKQDTTDSCSFLFLSNMMQDKGVYSLLHACEILSKKDLNFECHFVGDWSDIDEESFHNIVDQLAISEQVFAHGKKYGTDKNPFMTNADVFVHPTHEDCFPLVLLEAMQNSLPIIASDEGAIPEMVINNKSGYLVLKKDAVDLASKMEKIINNKEHGIEMGKESRLRYNELFTFQIFEKNLISILSEINSTVK